MRAIVALVVLAALAVSLPAATPAKGFARAVLVGANGEWVDVRAAETTIDGLLSRRGAQAPIRGGFLRLVFVGPGEFPANPARYYPAGRCVALDWPRYEITCRRISSRLVRLLERAKRLSTFHRQPTVLARLTLDGGRAVPALATAVELALARSGRPTTPPIGCYALSGRWSGPAAARRPARFHVCADGVQARGRLHLLGRGPWEWLRLNVGPPTYSAAGISAALPLGWEVVHGRLTPCTDPIERLVVRGRGGLVMVQESLGPRQHVQRLSPRPQRFALRGKPRFIACCAPPGRGRGWLFNFRDSRRGFYAYVFLGQQGTRAEALEILDSLDVRPR
jgi:hypothetical protein